LGLDSASAWQAAEIKIVVENEIFEKLFCTEAAEA
jgi:hypothetical protein